LDGLPDLVPRINLKPYTAHRNRLWPCHGGIVAYFPKGINFTPWFAMIQKDE
jgi:hypothetical protein